MLAIGAHGPVALDARDLVDEILQEPRAVGRMDHLGVEHDAVHLAFGVAEDGEGRVLQAAEHLKTVGQRDDPVAMAHPDLMALADRPHAVEKRALLLDLDKGSAELAVIGALGLAAHLHAERHLAIADPEDRVACLEDHLRCARAADIARRSRPARQDDRLGLDTPERFFAELEGHDFRINARFADAPGDQLRELAAEIKDEDGVAE